MRKLGFLIITLILLFSPTSSVYAESGSYFSQGNYVTIQKGEVVDHDFFAGGGNVTVSGVVNGDLYAAGGNLVIDGVVNGDLIAAGGTITIAGEVINNLRVAGGNISITGKVGKNILVGAGTLVISKESQIGGSLIAGAGTLDINAPLKKTIWLGSGQARINAKVDGSVYSRVEELTLGTEAKINGDLNYWSKKQANFLPGATVSGQIKKELIVPKESPRFFGFLSGFALTLKIISTLSLLILGLLIFRFFPKKTLEISDTFAQNPFGNLAWGLTTLLVGGFIALLFIFSLFGLPVGLLIFTILGISLQITPIFVGLWLGRKLFSGFDQKNGYVWALILGIIIFQILTLIPLIGWLLKMVAVLLGFGALVKVKKATYQQLKAQL